MSYWIKNHKIINTLIGNIRLQTDKSNIYLWIDRHIRSWTGNCQYRETVPDTVWRCGWGGPWGSQIQCSCVVVVDRRDPYLAWSPARGYGWWGCSSSSWSSEDWIKTPVPRHWPDCCQTSNHCGGPTPSSQSVMDRDKYSIRVSSTFTNRQKQILVLYKSPFNINQPSETNTL